MTQFEKLEKTNGEDVEKSGECYIKLTKSQIDNLIEFFEMCFIDMIRDVDEIDNINYICDMCDIYKKLKEVSEE